MGREDEFRVPRQFGSDSWAHHAVKPPPLPGFMCPHWHAHHQGYSNSFGTVGAQPMVVEVHVGLLHVPDEVGHRHDAHQSAGFQVQLLLSSGEQFLSICGSRGERMRRSFSSTFAVSPSSPRPHSILTVSPLPEDLSPGVGAPAPTEVSRWWETRTPESPVDASLWVREKTPGFRTQATMCPTPTFLGWLHPGTSHTDVWSHPCQPQASFEGQSDKKLGGCDG